MRSFNNVPHLVCRVTAARATAKIVESTRNTITLQVRGEDRRQVENDIPGITADSFSTQVMNRLDKLLEARGIKLHSVSTEASREGFQLKCEVTR